LIRCLLVLILWSCLSIANAETHYLLESVSNLNPIFSNHKATPYPNQRGAWSVESPTRKEQYKHKQHINLLGQIVVVHDYFWGFGSNREQVEITDEAGKLVDLQPLNNKLAKVIYQSPPKLEYDRITLAFQMEESKKVITVKFMNDMSGPPFTLLKDLVEIESKYLGKTVWLALPWWYENSTNTGGSQVAAFTKARVTKIGPSGDPHHPVSVFLDDLYHVDVAVTPLWSHRVWTLGIDGHLLLEDPFADMPKHIKELVLQKRVIPGMTEKQTVMAWGLPHYLKITDNSHLKYWYWRDNQYVLFRDGIAEQVTPGQNG